MTFHPLIIFDDLKIWEVLSQSSNNTYVCSADDEGYVFCSCPDFINRKAKYKPKLKDVELHCKHLKEVLN